MPADKAKKTGLAEIRQTEEVEEKFDNAMKGLCRKGDTDTRCSDKTASVRRKY
jgi:hypothetical protein